MFFLLFSLCPRAEPSRLWPRLEVGVSWGGRHLAHRSHYYISSDSGMSAIPEDGYSSEDEPQLRPVQPLPGEDADTTDESEVPQGEAVDEALLSILDEDYRVTRSLDDYRRRWEDDSDSSEGEGGGAEDEEALVENHYEQLGDDDYSEFVYVPRSLSPEPEEEPSVERPPADPPRISVAPLSRGEVCTCHLRV